MTETILWDGKPYQVTKSSCKGLAVTTYKPVRSKQEQQDYHETVTERCRQLLRQHQLAGSAR